THEPLEDMFGIRQFFSPQPFGNPRANPPEFVAAIEECLSSRHLGKIIAVAGWWKWRKAIVLVQQHHTEAIDRTCGEVSEREQREVDSVAIGKEHKIGKTAVILWRWVVHCFGHLHNYQLTKTLYPSVVVNERSDFGDKVEDVEILEDITRRVGVRA